MEALALPATFTFSKPTVSVPCSDSKTSARFFSSLACRSALASSRCLLRPQRSWRPHTALSSGSDALVTDDDDSDEALVQPLRVPESWMTPSNALQESEWLRITLHKWLDDEYCPEPANVEISKVAAQSYYESLLAKQAELGEILLRMVKALESVSFQESFHGVFSSANAAVHLITLRMESTR